VTNPIETITSWFGVQLADPWYLLSALVMVPAVLWSRRAAGRVVFSSLETLPSATTWRIRLAWLPDALIGLAVLCLAVALAGPRKPDAHARVKREGIAIAMVIDTSSSMDALDLDDEVSRLDVVKDVVERFVMGGGGLRGRIDDAIGLVSFARYADTRSPLTLQHRHVVEATRALTISSTPGEDGTALGDGLAMAVERLRSAPMPSKVAVVLTDGVSNAGEIAPLAAAELARDAGVRVYTIGAGSKNGARMRVTDPFTGGTRLVSVPVEIDEATLRAVADRAGGAYFRATDRAGLVHIYQEIDRLERTEISEQQFSKWDQYYGWFVIAALLAAAAAFGLRASVLRRLP